jgi:type I restriction enzyme S subunit
VTKGLPARHSLGEGGDPNVELVDSGIEWIGKIPKGWEVRKLKYVSDMNRRTLSENTPGDYSFKYYDISSVNEENITSIEADTIFEKAPSRARRIVNSGDSIIATVRTYLKAVAFFVKVESNIIASTGFAVLSPKKVLEPKYLYSYIQSDRFINEVIIRSKGISYPAINPSDLGSIEIVYPKINEQDDIEKYLDEKVSGTNEILLKIEDSIRILKEFKSSLISNVVTGKVMIES